MYVYLVPAVVEPERFFIRDAAAPVEVDRLYSRKPDPLLKIEIASADGAESVPIHDNGVSVVIHD